MSLFAIFFRERKGVGWGSSEGFDRVCRRLFKTWICTIVFRPLEHFLHSIWEPTPWYWAGANRVLLHEWYLISFCFGGRNEIKRPYFQQFCDSLTYTQYWFSLRKERKGEKTNLYSLAHNGKLMFSIRQLP